MSLNYISNLCTRVISCVLLKANITTCKHFPCLQYPTYTSSRITVYVHVLSLCVTTLEPVTRSQLYFSHHMRVQLRKRAQFNCILHIIKGRPLIFSPAVTTYPTPSLIFLHPSYHSLRSLILISLCTHHLLKPLHLVLHLQGSPGVLLSYYENR